MAGHKEHGPSTRGWEILRNIGLTWAVFAAIFEGPLLVPAILAAAGAQAEIGIIKRWGGVRKGIHTIFVPPRKYEYSY